jgi:ABC-type uncharacterized transport system permease subunit
MNDTLYQSADIVSTSLTTAIVATLAAGLLCALGLSWTSDKWRPSVALAGVALLASGVAYLQSAGIWHATGELSAAPRYVGWYTAQPALVAAAAYCDGTGWNPAVEIRIEKRKKLLQLCS